MFSRGGCRVFLLDVSHVVEGRSSTPREARERNERRRLKYIGPSDKFLDFFLYFRDFFFVLPRALSLSLLTSRITSFHVSPQKGSTSEEGRKFGTFIAVNQPPFV